MNIKTIERHEIQNPKQSPYLDWIKQGKKKYEGRLATKLKPKPEGWDLFIGKEIIFFDKDDPKSWVWIRVTKLLKFTNFGEAFDKLGSKLIPEKTREEVVKLYDGLFGESEISKNGAIAIGFDVIKYN